MMLSDAVVAGKAADKALVFTERADFVVYHGMDNLMRFHFPGENVTIYHEGEEFTFAVAELYQDVWEISDSIPWHGPLNKTPISSHRSANPAHST